MGVSDPGVREVLGRLADLPVAIGSGPHQRGVHVVAFECSERQNSASSYGGFVNGGVQYGGQAGGETDTSERSDRRFPHERVGVLHHGAAERGRDPFAEIGCGLLMPLTECPGDDLDQNVALVLQHRE